MRRRLTEEDKNNLVNEFMKTNISASDICEKYGISRPTLYRTLKAKGINDHQGVKVDYRYDAYAVNYDCKNDTMIISVNGLSLAIARGELLAHLDVLFKAGVSSEFMNVTGDALRFTVEKTKVIE